VVQLFGRPPRLFGHTSKVFSAIGLEAGQSSLAIGRVDSSKTFEVFSD